LVIFLTLFLFSDHPVKDIDVVLDSFHTAASKADFVGYFSLLSEDAVFIGTDAGEMWTKKEFAGFCKPYFDHGKGWTYLPVSRTIHVTENGMTAWFVEILQNEHYGTCRGTGVLKNTPKGWLIVQYHLTIPIPNGVAKDVVAKIREFEQFKK